MTSMDHHPAPDATDTTRRNGRPDGRHRAISAGERAVAERRLRLTLRANAVTSIVCGSILALAPHALDDLLGTGHPGWVRLVGIGVVLFGADVWWTSTRPLGKLVRQAPGIIAADAAWVVLSIVTLLLGWFSGWGIAAVIAMALAVDTFAFLQFRSWRVLRTTR